HAGRQRAVPGLEPRPRRPRARPRRRPLGGRPRRLRPRVAVPGLHRRPARGDGARTDRLLPARLGADLRRPRGVPEDAAGVDGRDADRRLARMTARDALVVGGSQCLALLPGISRSGISMVAGLLRGLSHPDAARFSFLLATPVILAAGVLKLPDLFGPLGNGV